MAENADPKPVGAYVGSGMPIVCLAKCWGCAYGEHFDPPQWHTWADEDDIEHARETGQDDPSTSRCGCRCSEVDRG